MNHYEALLSSASRVSATGLHASHESILRGLGVCSGDDLLVAMSPLRYFKSVSIDNNLVEDLSTEIYLEQQCRSLPTFAHYDDYQWGLRRLSDSRAEKIHLALQTFCTQSIDSISLEALTREIDAYPALLFLNKLDVDQVLNVIDFLHRHLDLLLTHHLLVTILFALLQMVAMTQV
jgi:hypothetical protein